MNWAGAIVPLAVIAVLAVVILVIFLYVRGRLRNFSQQAFGTSDLSQAVKQIENASESARSIHGMTDIYLPQIHHDFPDFDYDVFKGRVEGVLRPRATSHSSPRTALRACATASAALSPI